MHPAVLSIVSGDDAEADNYLDNTWKRLSGVF